jgi:hypothetical protein
MAVDGNSVFLTFGAPNTIYFARSRDGGHSFDNPVRVATVTKMDLGRHRGPRIAVAGNKIVISAVVTDEAQGVKGDLLAWISGDEGRSWSAPVRVNDVPRSAEEGLHDSTWPLDARPMDGGGLASGANGQIVSVWRREKTIYGSFATGAEQEVGPGKDADVAFAKDGRYVVLISPEGLVVTGPDSGRPALLDAQGGFGQLRTLKDGRVIAGWESPEGVKIQVLRSAHACADLPA